MKKFIFLFTTLSVMTLTHASIIHHTRIITPDNQKSEVFLWLHLGKLKNNSCHVELIIQPTISMMLQTGDSVPVDGDEILKFAEPGFTCATLNFQRSEQERTSDYFILQNNADNSEYAGSRPDEGLVSIN